LTNKGSHGSLLRGMSHELKNIRKENVELKEAIAELDKKFETLLFERAK